MEKTLVIIKPDAVQRGLVGEILRRFERKGLRIAALRMRLIGEQTAVEHYGIHRGRPFFDPLIRYITSGPSVLAVVVGVAAIQVVRSMIGSTFGADAAPGTIRGDLGMSKRFNLVHASDSAAAAAKEMALFFGEGEIVEYAAALAPWVYDLSGPEPV